MFSNQCEAIQLYMHEIHQLCDIQFFNVLRYYQSIFIFLNSIFTKLGFYYVIF